MEKNEKKHPAEIILECCQINNISPSQFFASALYIIFIEFKDISGNKMKDFQEFLSEAGKKMEASLKAAEESQK